VRRSVCGDMMTAAESLTELDDTNRSHRLFDTFTRSRERTSNDVAVLGDDSSALHKVRRKIALGSYPKNRIFY
jgi:hypothetical protein